MKKYLMLIVTIFMLILTTAAYRYENNVQAPQIKQPSISINSKRFGLIKNIVWTNKYMNDGRSLIILSTRNTEQGAISYLYHLNADTGKAGLLVEFPSHKNLSSVVLFDTPTGINSIIAAYDQGIIKVSYLAEELDSSTYEKIEIAGFDTATSMDLKANLAYTRENDNLLYIKNLSNGLTSIFTNNNIKDLSTYYLKPLYIGNINSLDNIITYTSINRDRIDLFGIKNGMPVNTLNTPIIKNVITIRGIEDSYGFAGMNILEEPNNSRKLNLFMLRRNIDKYNNIDDYYSLDTIPYNMDPFGAIPVVDSTTYNDNFSLAYTSYDENHKGSIKICSLNQQPKIIVKDENIFGPIDMTGLLLPADKSVTHILYFTYENNNVGIKICNSSGELVKDITDMIIKSN